MGEPVDIATAIVKRDITDAALIMAAARKTFTAAEFAEFLRIARHEFDAETVNDWLSEMAADGRLREIGPGVYARPVAHNSGDGGARIGGQP